MLAREASAQPPWALLSGSRGQWAGAGPSEGARAGRAPAHPLKLSGLTGWGSPNVPARRGLGLRLVTSFSQVELRLLFEGVSEDEIVMGVEVKIT